MAKKRGYLIMPKGSNSNRFHLGLGGAKASHSKCFSDFVIGHSEQLTPEDFTKNFVILNLFQNLKIFSLFHIGSGYINSINRSRIECGMTNIRHSERSEESLELSELLLVVCRSALLCRQWKANLVKCGDCLTGI